MAAAARVSQGSRTHTSFSLLLVESGAKGGLVHFMGSLLRLHLYSLNCLWFLVHGPTAGVVFDWWPSEGRSSGWVESRVVYGVGSVLLAFIRRQRLV